jgi:hypothetical protein
MKLDRFVVAATAGAALLCATFAGISPVRAVPFAAKDARALGSGSLLIPIQHRHYRHHGNGAAAAAGAAAGAAVVLGTLAAGQAIADETYYTAPPPSTVTYNGRSMDGGETTDDALRACRTGILDAARRYGALDARIGTVDMVSQAPDGGHDVHAEITVYYPDYARSAAITCHTRDGTLLSARADN